MAIALVLENMLGLDHLALVNMGAMVVLEHLMYKAAPLSSPYMQGERQVTATQTHTTMLGTATRIPLDFSP